MSVLKGKFKCDISSRPKCFLGITVLLCLLILNEMLFPVFLPTFFQIFHPRAAPMKPRRNIFFVETSGAIDLGHRQACSVESAAIHNSLRFNINLVIKVLGNSPDENSFVNLLGRYYKIDIVPFNIQKMFRATPTEHLYSNREFDKSPFKIFHESDLWRMMLIWSYGGIYLDLDIIVLRSFEDHNNFLVIENANELASAIFGFDKHHPFLLECLTDFSKNYDPKRFIANGPALLTRNAQKFCHEQNLSRITFANCGIWCFISNYAFEIYYNELNTLFRSPYNEASLKRINSSQVVHLWNYLTHKISTTEVGGNSLVEKLMRDNCPIVYSEIVKRKLKYL